VIRDIDVQEEMHAFNAGFQEEEARRGNTEAAIDILREFVDTVELSSNRDVPIPWHSARYLADAFRKIIDHDMDAALALGIRTDKAGRPRGMKMHNEVELAAAYCLLVRRGFKPEEANKLVGKETGADRRTVQRATKACSTFGDRSLIDDEVLKSILRPQLLKTLSTK
jgi:hypothetical protein